MARPLSAPPLRRLGRSSYVRWTTYQELERCTGVSSSAGPSTPRWTRSQSTSTKPKTRGPLIKRPPTDKKTAVVDPKTSYGSSVSASREEMGKARQDWNTSLAWLGEPDKDHVNWRRVTAADLQSKKDPPKRVKMLVREFIHDSLYNPHYGYFSKKATIFRSPPGGYDFSKFRDQSEFQEEVAKRYAEEYGDMVEGGLGRQVWHTPTELFSPYYAQALVSAIIASHLRSSSISPLIIYELGAGNGSFMADALAFIRDRHPDLWPRTKYRIIEISPELARIQRERAREVGVEDKVEIINRDFFDWDGGTKEECFVVALEVLDNFAHDMVRYDIHTLEPYQSLVTVDPTGDFNITYEPITDPLLSECLTYYGRLPRTSSTSPNLSPLMRSSPLLRRIYAELPFSPNLSPPDWIPTKAISFLSRLRAQLPNHRLLIADFATLPDTIPGRNAPVVQTRLGRAMVCVDTFLVKQGFFDIFFPTDFKLLKDIQNLIAEESTSRTVKDRTQDPSSAQSVSPSIEVSTQADFVSRHGGPELGRKLRTKDGTSIMQAMYGNAKVMF